jgi:D-alanyl-D-alanine dipeptidase
MRNAPYLASAALLSLILGCGQDAPVGGGPLSPPPEPPLEWATVLGEYAEGADTLSLLEDGGRLFLLFWEEGWGGERLGLAPLNDTTFEVGSSEGTALVRRGPAGRPRSLTLEDRELVRIELGVEEGETFRITPLRPPAELREEALAAAPPEEEGDFLPSELVDVLELDPTLRLDIRYATTDNFMGEVFYSSPRAFLQRPAAEAVVRAHDWLKERGFGLLIFDAYRPWYVTKMFWDATPEPMRWFVANPARGSRHNRGCAVDLTLVDLATGEAVAMPGGYDEISPRSHVAYPGGTARQRWYRELLREAMEAQGFTVIPDEWWHFDYQDWRRYRIENRVFEEIG